MFTPPHLLLDVCCGTGTIGICLAGKPREGRHVKLLGVEMNEGAVNDARTNAAVYVCIIMYSYNSNGLSDDARYVAAKAESVMDQILRHAGMYYIISHHNRLHGHSRGTGPTPVWTTS